MSQDRLYYLWCVTIYKFLFVIMKGNILVLLSIYYMFNVMLGNRYRKMNKIQFLYLSSFQFREKIVIDVIG